jgi:hypothetical protein
MIEMTVRNGDLGVLGIYGESGGGIRNTGDLTLNGLMLTGNTAGLEYGWSGGMSSYGVLNLADVTISNNTARSTGGLSTGGEASLTNVTISGNMDSASTAGMSNYGTAQLTNVTISGNRGGPFTSSGGGFGNRGSAQLKNVTITDNTGGASGGIYVPYASWLTPITILIDTIVAGNSSRDCSVSIHHDAYVSLGHNLDSDGSCRLTAPSDLPNTSPLLGPLHDNGGLTFTHALLPGSPAIDAGSDDCFLADQRGVTRPQDGDRDGIAACDIGAFEVEPQVLSIEIDINPGFFPNIINTRMNFVISVALLGSENFDVADIDVTTLRFGPGEASPAHDLTDLFTYNNHLQDVNLDGFMDLMTHFPMQDTGIACGDESATLTGSLLSGYPIEGTDSVRTVGCGQRKDTPSIFERQPLLSSRETDPPVDLSIKE